MPVYRYGATTIDWEFQEDPRLKRHYVTVERGKPVLLRGPSVPEDEQVELIRYRARWIKQRLEEVNQPLKPELVTGSRLPYRGKTWYCHVQPALELSQPRIMFRNSRFYIQSPEGGSISKQALKEARNQFYRDRAKDKLFPRIRHWQRQTGLQALSARLHAFRGRWASCTDENILEFHPRCMELSPSVLDYVIVHELCHTVEKNHSKAFWLLVEKHYPGWQRCHAEIERLGVEV
ncbi:M48 family metallopeptidase [Sansalvadorimonas verongulae]|uniref:M48 family metallopeptidase n=1 Tax=Sansalvadorimonas verongulae TaxID=2172824 RepID=UPI0012BCD402|nr:SprT family zinc-dependent metalloprotease [Sansalvadorimonas verongulae]MTI12154.1 M48 family peptidase [Sansalvadorimonas verongulae]